MNGSSHYICFFQPKGVAIHGLIVPIGNEVVLFDDSYNGTLELRGLKLLNNGLVQVTSRTNGETSIPKGGFILQGKAKGLITSKPYPGTPLSVKMTILETRDMENG